MPVTAISAPTSPVAGSRSKASTPPCCSILRQSGLRLARPSRFSRHSGAPCHPARSRSALYPPPPQFRVLRKTPEAMPFQASACCQPGQTGPAASAKAGFREKPQPPSDSSISWKRLFRITKPAVTVPTGTAHPVCRRTFVGARSPPAKSGMPRRCGRMPDRSRQ
jgi:hypothetical protein